MPNGFGWRSRPLLAVSADGSFTQPMTATKGQAIKQEGPGLGTALGDIPLHVADGIRFDAIVQKLFRKVSLKKRETRPRLCLIRHGSIKSSPNDGPLTAVVVQGPQRRNSPDCFPRSQAWMLVQDGTDRERPADSRRAIQDATCWLRE
jgi:hypothetical protein